MTKILIKVKCRKIPKLLPQEMVDWVSIKKGSKLFFVSEHWVRNQVALGRLRSFKVKGHRFVHSPSLKNLVNDLSFSPGKGKRKRRKS